MGLGSRNPAVVGSAEEVADDLTSWVEEPISMCFNLSRIVTPESLEDFVDLVVPILQGARRLQAQLSARHLALEKLFAGSRLLRRATRPPEHRRPAAFSR